MAAKKRKEVQQENKLERSKMLLIAVSLILVSIITVASAILFFPQQSSEVIFPLKAAIIDQLSIEYPNPSFVKNVTKILEDYNFKVTHHNQTLNVEFFRKLVTYNYGIIILRVHSALRNDNSTVDFFTSEPYKENLYVQEQQHGLLVEGVLNYSGVEKHYFAITYKFIKNLEGRLPKSVIIAMGCWSLKPECKQMAEAFIEKGAAAYIGWNNMVAVSHTDRETLKLIKNLVENKTINDAVNSGLSDPLWRSKMGYYPITAREITISSLIKETKNSPAFNQLLNYLGYFICCESKSFRLHVSKHVC